MRFTIAHATAAILTASLGFAVPAAAQAQKVLNPIEALRNIPAMCLTVAAMRDLETFLPQARVREEVAARLTQSGVTVLPPSDACEQSPELTVRVNNVLFESEFTYDAQVSLVLPIQMPRAGGYDVIRATTWFGNTIGVVPVSSVATIDEQLDTNLDNFVRMWIAANARPVATK